MMCQEVMELMQRYIDGDLDERETSLMMDHVGQCPDCAAMLNRLQRLSNELEQLPRVVPRFSLVDAILPELERLNKSETNADTVSTEAEEDAAANPRISRSGRPGREWFRRLSSVVALGVVVGLLLFIRPDQWPFSSVSHNDEAGPSLDEPASEQGDVSMTMSAPNNKEIADTKEKADIRSAPASPPEANLPPKQEVSPAPTEPMREIDPNTPVSNNDAPVTKDAPVDGGEDVAVEPVPTELPGIAGKLPSISGDLADGGTGDNMSLGAVEPTVSFMSPDGKWRAINTEGTGIIQVYNTEDDTLLFESEARQGSIGNLTWNPESTYLNYTWFDLDGNATQLMFDVANVQELTVIANEPEN